MGTPDTLTSAGLEPMHFGPGERLYGMRSEPLGCAARQTAVLICHSWGAEYQRSYRGCYRLSEQLAMLGFDTLRFDYSCTGDSAGEEADARLPCWLDDIDAAARELRELSGCSRLCVLGLRLGGLLALEAVARGLRADQLVLWDLPASGRSWIDELLVLHAASYERKNRYRPQRLALPLPADELLGSPWPAALADAIAALHPQPRLPAERLLLIDSADTAIERGSQWQTVQRRVLDEAAHWTQLDKLNTPLGSTPSARTIAGALAELLP